MYCSRCGKKNTFKGARFCHSCGSPLEGVSKKKNPPSSPYDKPITYQDTWAYWDDSQYDERDDDYDEDDYDDCDDDI